MRFKSYILILLFVSGFIIQCTTRNNMLQNDPSVKVDKLKNGLTYYIKNNKYPENRLELLLVVDTGSVMEDDDQQGLAHFAEHMAFNGTIKYPKNELVDYLESIGMQFGPDLNAYTSFDETVYMLQVPVNDESNVEKAFEILSEWANYITFENEEIDKERGVIIEEWRLGRGAESRIRDKKIPIYFKGSKYAERLPIGKKDIIENFDYNVIKRFYKDWYRTDLMAIVAVGDLEPDIIEKYIEKYFNKIKKKTKPRERIIEDLPSFDNYRVAIGSDPELRMPSVGITYFFDAEEESPTLENFKNSLMKTMITQMLNMRLSDLTKKEDPDFIYAGSYNAGRFIRPKNMFALYGGVQETKIEIGFKSLVRELERIIRFGFIEEELNRTKAQILSQIEQATNEKDKTESRRYKFKYKDHYLTRKPYYDIEDQLNLFNSLKTEIKVNDINALALELFSSKNKILDVDFPEKESVKIMTKDEVIEIYNSVLNETIEPYYEEEIAEELFSKKVIPGTIISEERDDVLNTVKLKLSNGLKVIYKKTDFKNDEILFTAFSEGGHSLVSDDKYISANEAANIISYSGLGPYDAIQFEKYLSDKNVTVAPYIRELGEGFDGHSNKKYLETMFQMIHLYFTEPREDNGAFNSYIDRKRGEIENKNLSPEGVFFDSIRSVVNSNHFRSKALNIKTLSEINLKDVVSIYKERFNEPGDFTFIFVGNIEEEVFYQNVNKYLGSIPSLGRKESWFDVGKKAPKGKINEFVYKGMEPKSLVYFAIIGDVDWNETNEHNIRTLGNAFSIKLEKVLREEMGGTYGVWVASELYHYPNERYRFRVIFGCDPEKVDELTDAFYTQIDSVKLVGLKEEFLEKTQEQQRKEFEKNIKENKYWLNELKSMYLNNSTNYKLVDYYDMIDNFKNDDIKNLANKYLNMENYVKVVLYPENK